MSPIIARNSVLVTGGAGFIGANLINKLLDLNYRVSILVKESTDLLRLKNVINKINIYKVDLLDKNLKKIITKINPSKIFHLATYSSYRNQEESMEMIDANIRGTLNLLMSTRGINYDIFVNTGSSSEYGIKDKAMREEDVLSPISFYAATKASITLLCNAFARECQKPIVTIRPFSVYGPYEEKTRFVPTIIKAIIENKTIKLTSGSQRRDFIYIEDVVDIYIKTMKMQNPSGQILNAGTGIQYTNDEVVETLFRVTEKRVPIQKGEFPKRIWDTSNWVADMSKTKRLLNWEPKFTLEMGLKRTYLWNKNGKI